MTKIVVNDEISHQEYISKNRNSSIFLVKCTSCTLQGKKDLVPSIYIYLYMKSWKEISSMINRDREIVVVFTFQCDNHSEAMIAI